MTTYFLDNFDGAGSIPAHVPDVSIGSVRWGDSYGGCVLSGGGITLQQPSGMIYYGDGVTDYGIPITSYYGFQFTTGSDTTPANNNTYFSVVLDFIGSGGNFNELIASVRGFPVGGNNGANLHISGRFAGGGPGIDLVGVQNVSGPSVTISPNTTYWGYVQFTAGTVFFNFNGTIFSGSYTFSYVYPNQFWAQSFVSVGTPTKLDYFYIASTQLFVPYHAWWKDYSLTDES